MPIVSNTATVSPEYPAGLWKDPWFDPNYVPHDNPAVNPLTRVSNDKITPTLAKQSLLREKLFHMFQGGQLRFLPMSDGVTEETPEMRAEYIKMFLKEPSIKAALLSKIIAVASMKWSILPASEDPKDKRVAEWVDHCIRSCKGGLRKICENVLLFGLVNGQSLNEKLYAYQKSRKFADLFPDGYVTNIFRIKVKTNLDYRLEVDQFRNVKGIWSHQAARRFDPSYFVLFNFMPMYENPAGTSDLRAAIRAYNIINMAHQFRAIYLEQFSLPVMKGTIKDPNDKEMMQFLESAIQDVRSLGWFVVPEGTAIEALNIAARGESEFNTTIEDLRKEIYLCLVGSYLQAMEGDTPGGAGSSSVHKSTQELFIWYLAELLSEVINDQIITELVGMNLSDVDPPRIQIAAIEDTELLVSAEILTTLQNAGLDVSKKETYKRFQITPPVDESDALKPAAQSQPGMGGMGGEPGGMPGGVPGGDGKDMLAGLKRNLLPKDSVKMSDSKPPTVAPQAYHGGAEALYSALSRLNANKLNVVSLANEMGVGEDGLIDYGTLFRVARYHGLSTKLIDGQSDDESMRNERGASVFDINANTGGEDSVVITAMNLPGQEPGVFVVVEDVDMVSNNISVIASDGKEVSMPLEDFLADWPVPRKVLVLSTEEPDDGDEEAAPVPNSPVHQMSDTPTDSKKKVDDDDNTPAGPDGKDIVRLLNQAITMGARDLEKIARPAVERLLQGGEAGGGLLNEEELAKFSESLAKACAPADLLGRYTMRLRQHKAKRLKGDEAEKFSESPVGLFGLAKFAEGRAITPMNMGRSLDYFRGLVPKMNVQPTLWGKTLKRKVFTMAEASNKTMLVKAQKAIADAMKQGKNGTQAVQDVLDAFGVTPKNPQYCFLPDTLVEGEIVAASKANYDGPAVEIQTNEGRRLCVSINHPILTVNGWKAAGDIQEGEYLVCYGDPVESLSNQSGSAVTSPERRAVDNQKVPARVEDVFKAILEKCPTLLDVQRPVAPLDFHGDAAFMDGKIDRIWADGVLERVPDSDSVKFTGKIGLVERGDVASVPASHSDSGLSFSGSGMPDPSLASGEVGCSSNTPCSTGVSPLCLMSIGTVSDINPSVFKALEKTAGGDVQLASNLMVSFPGVIKVNCVVKVKHFRWTGHVYDLQTTSGYIVSQGILTSNCEMVYRTNMMDSLNQAAEEERMEPDMQADFPVWKYMGIRDGRQGADHEPHFDNYYPAKVPFRQVRGERAYNCRCQAVPVYVDEWNIAKKRGKSLAKKYSEMAEFAELGSHKDFSEYHGPVPPGGTEHWTHVGTGPRGGKIWRRRETEKLMKKPVEKSFKKLGFEAMESPNGEWKDAEHREEHRTEFVDTFEKGQAHFERIGIEVKKLQKEINGTTDQIKKTKSMLELNKLYDVLRKNERDMSEFHEHSGQAQRDVFQATYGLAPEKRHEYNLHMEEGVPQDRVVKAAEFIEGIMTNAALKQTVKGTNYVTGEVYDGPVKINFINKPEPHIRGRVSAYARQSWDGAVVHCKDGDDVAVYVHELGHTVEFYFTDESKAKLEAFRLDRFNGARAEYRQLNKLFPKHGFDSSEVTMYSEGTHGKGAFNYENYWNLNPDRSDDENEKLSNTARADQKNESAKRRAAYMGKIYQNGSTEIVSMGLELLYTAPAHFAKADPEYFGLMMSILQPDEKKEEKPKKEKKEKKKDDKGSIKKIYPKTEFSGALRTAGFTGHAILAHDQAIQYLDKLPKDREHGVLLDANTGDVLSSASGKPPTPGGWANGEVAAVDLGHYDHPDSPLISVHTHMDEISSFSDGDWGMHALRNEKAMSVIDKNYVYTVVKSKKDREQTEGRSPFTPRDLKEKWNSVLAEVESENMPDKEHKQKYEDAGAIIHEVNNRMAKFTGYTYTRYDKKTGKEV